MKHILIEMFENALHSFYNIRINDSRDKIDKSKKRFEKIIEIDEDFAPAYFYLGRIYQILGDGSKAGSLFNEYLMYGFGEHNAGNYLGAIRIFNDMILHMPFYSKFFEYRANSYKELGLFKKYENDKKTIECLESNKRVREYYIFIDTETNGIPHDWNAPMKDINNWPRIVQIAWILSDDEGNIINEDNYIIKPEGFQISDESSEIHGISNDIANTKGANLQLVLWRMSDATKFSNNIVAHNIHFDFNVIGAEYTRKNTMYNLIGRKKICTMKSSTDYCKIVGPNGYKWPKLDELYYKLFKEELVEMHDALIDVNATYKCYWKLKEINLV